MRSDSDTRRIAPDALRRLLGRDARSDSRVDTLMLVASEGPISQAAVARNLTISPPAAKKLLDGLADEGFLQVDASGKRPAYVATALGEEIAQAFSSPNDLTALLAGRVLMCVRRPTGRPTSDLRRTLLDSAESLLTGYGSYLYVAICRDDPELVADLLAKVDKVGGEAATFAVSPLGRSPNGWSTRA